ncbi:hypothetical protein F4861DRAFT_549352 [Xylaria intraflava]|nr:hypothetical protein F4861DRAFT_549352 [Xylaria intraflava]
MMDNTGSPPFTSEDLGEEPKCMYTAACNTGSTLRKAISHIFGRNKLCTRMIPNVVWVHYCRKHYQRSRYRNGAEYTRIQCDLVKTQISRLQAWSDGNKLAGRPGVVQSWSLALRKRESNRLRERPGNEVEIDSDGDSQTTDNAVLNGTAVPRWLRAKCGDGYSTEEIEVIVGEIQNAINKGHLSQIPDIEFLPNISTDGTEETSPTTTTESTMTSESAHKCPAHGEPSPPNVATHTVSRLSLTPQSNQTTASNPWHANNLSQANSRQTVGNTPCFNAPATNVSEGMLPGAVLGLGSAPGQIVGLAYRQPMNFPQPQENHPKEPYHGTECGSGSYNGGHDVSNGPSTIPRIQYLINTPILSQMPSNTSSPQRATHQRSASEYRGFTQHPELPPNLVGVPTPCPFVSTYSEAAYAHLGPLQRQDHHAMPAHNHSVSQSCMADASGLYIRQPVPGSNNPRRQSAPDSYENAQYPYYLPTD